MPAIKSRTRIIAQNFIASSGLYRDATIEIPQIFFSASAVANMSASLAMAAPTACGPTFLRWTGTSSGCEVSVQVPIPQDIALNLPAAASGNIYFDWLCASGDGKKAIIGACLAYIPAGSAWVTAGGCSLMTPACATLTGASVNAINSSSVAQWNVPPTRNGTLVLRFKVSGQDDNHTSGSDFELARIRLRYLSDRIGS